MKADVGLIGLAVMGQNLVLNINDRGYSVAVHNRSPGPIRAFMSGSAADRAPAAGKPGIVAAEDMAEFVALLERPRKIILLIKAGAAVDQTIAHLAPLLDAGDLIIDGGNSFWTDTERRASELAARGLLFIGTGVSGGEEGARHGPSLMPGGDPKAWPLVRDIFEAIAAKSPTGSPCCAWMGPGGAGHFVKMVHNGIEYGDMELIAETYQLLHEVLGLDYTAMATTFADWNQTDLNSYLIEISARILGTKDDDGGPILEKILDAAGQKGTGKWASQGALDAGIPLTLITEAVYARALSALVEDRRAAAPVLTGPGPAERAALIAGKPRDNLIEDMRKALLAAKIVSYTQGFMLLRQASTDHDWKLDFGSIAMTWQGGCIIRSTFLVQIQEAFARNPGLPSLLTDRYFKGILDECQPALRRVMVLAVSAGIPVPALSAALMFYDGYRSARLPANMLQAQRDFFGAHTYERTDKPRGQFFHTDWIGSGGKAVSGIYNA